MSIFHDIRAMMLPDLAHIIEVQQRFHDLLSGAYPRMDEIADLLDSLDHMTRLACTRSLGAKQMSILFEAAEGFRPVTIDDVVPKEVGVRRPVHHYGKNSLPVFTIFQKRFLRPSQDATELWGYNHQALRPITGPGYYMARNDPGGREVLVDYTVVPLETPIGWPEVHPNERGLSNLVYAHMVDRLRGITEHVTIGRAWKKGKVQSAWFVLCRE